jgi:hypothetical protein
MGFPVKEDEMAVSFAADIKPLFRSIDVQHMKLRQVLLDDYGYMSDPAGDHQNATQVLAYLTGTPPRMPPGGPYWSDAQLALYAQWMSDGFQP